MPFYSTVCLFLLSIFFVLIRQLFHTIYLLILINFLLYSISSTFSDQIPRQLAMHQLHDPIIIMDKVEGLKFRSNPGRQTLFFHSP